MTPRKLQKNILAWFDQHGRKDLPWQHDKTPYRVWVSEIMLQQTQVSTVIAYFQRFIEQFPDVFTLASASEDAVLHLWTGLGYYSRARNLHRTAKIIAENFQGNLPSDLDKLQELPGIGLSTAGAILAIAFQKKSTILDGNVKRVLTRLYGITDWPGEKKILEQLWKIAEQLTPENRVADYTQAIMDLGATVCVRGKPRCNTCPLQRFCIAHDLGIEKTLPHSKPKKILPVRQKTFLLIQHNQEVLLVKRPESGIWGGLWSLPELPGFPAHDELRKTCRQQFQAHAIEIETGNLFRHTFSHFHLDIQPALITIKNRPVRIMDGDQQVWYNLRKPQAVGLPAPVKKLLGSLSWSE